jgi:hypothetical protein
MAMNGMYTTEIYKSSKMLDEISAYWQEVQWHPGADFQFYKLLLKNRETIISPYVIAAKRNGELNALLVCRIDEVMQPIRLGYITICKVPIRRIVVMDGGFMGERNEDVLYSLLACVKNSLAAEGLSLGVLENVRDGSIIEDTARRIFGTRMLPDRQEKSPHWLMRLPSSWNEFLKNRSRKHRYWLNHLNNTLNKKFYGKWNIVCFTSESEAIQFGNYAEAIAKMTYHRSLGVGFYRNDESIQRLTMEARRRQLNGYVLFVDNEPKAFWYCFKYGRTLYMAATGFDPQYRKYELGTVLLMHVFKEHCGSNIDYIDFGLGDAGYKQRFGSEKYYETSFLVFPNTVRSNSLYLLLKLVMQANMLIREITDRTGITMKIKTFWRRKKEMQMVKSNRYMKG